MKIAIGHYAKRHIWLSFKHILIKPLLTLTGGSHIKIEYRLADAIEMSLQTMTEETTGRNDEIVGLKRYILMVGCMDIHQTISLEVTISDHIAKHVDTTKVLEALL